MLEDGTLLSVAPGGESRITVPVPGVLVGRVTGHGSMDLAEAIELDMAAPLLRSRGEWQIFSDWYEMTGYDSAARVELTRWIRTMRPQIAGHTLLVRSRLVAMGVAVSNLALGGMVKATTDRAEFRRSMDIHIGGIRRGQGPHSMPPGSS